MTVTIPSWIGEACDGIRRLAQHPGTLFALLLALNALGRPASPTAHDARLYSLQALNQAEQGAYADDVFLNYGSQDQFSLFSHIVGPLVAVVGLRWTFFLFYVVFNTLFLWTFRLVRALFDDAVVATLALIFLVTAPLAYGGHDVFMVHEQFFTPRIIGAACTLFALERLVHGNYATTFALLLAGLLVHPLMTFGGVMIAACYLAASWLPTRLFASLVIVAALAGTMVLCIPMAATRIFGSMDDDWHQMIRLSVGYNYPDGWPMKDWLNVAVSLALPIAACVSLYRDDPIRRRFFVAVTVAGFVGLLTTAAASLLPYALLFQGQPYRVLWILKILQVPLSFLLIVRWSHSPLLALRIAALALVAFFCTSHYTWKEFWVIGVALAMSTCHGWMREEAAGSSAEGNSGWQWYAVARGFVLGALCWTGYRVWLFLSERQLLAQHFDLNEWVLLDLVSPIVWIVGFCLAAAWLSRSVNSIAALRWSAAAIALAAPVGLFALEISPEFRAGHTRLGGDIAFLRNFLDAKRPSHAGVPAVYSSLGRPDLLWIDVRATSYFDILQTAGVMFNRRTAEEIQRRAALVGKFELDRYRQEEMFLDDEKKVGIENLFKIPFDSPPATQDDLARLCQAPGLDYVVTTREFPGLYSAGNGRIYVYECRQVRIALRLPEPERPPAMAARS